MAVAEANKDAHAALMTRSKSKKVRVGIHNKMDVDLLIYDQTHDHGNDSQLHLEQIMNIAPGKLEHWFTEEKRFFRLVPNGKEWHGEGVHVVTSGTGAAGRNFEIGVHSEDEIAGMYPEEIRDEMQDDDDGRRRHPETYNIETVVYKHEHEL